MDDNRLKEVYAKHTSRRERMIEYLKLKIEENDWHGVADAAMDLREIEAKITLIGEIFSWYQ